MKLTFSTPFVQPGSWGSGVPGRGKVWVQPKGEGKRFRVIPPRSGRWGSRSHDAVVPAAAAPPGSAWGPPATGAEEGAWAWDLTTGPAAPPPPSPGTPPHTRLHASHLHHSMADSPVGLLSAQQQHGEDDQGAPARSHDQQTGHGLWGHSCPSGCLQGEQVGQGSSLRFTRAPCGFGSHSLANDL